MINKTSKGGKRKSPAFSFYPDSWFLGTAKMSPAQEGIYIRLLCLQWSDGPFTIEQAFEQSKRSATDEDIHCVLDLKFTLTDGRYLNERLEHERSQQADRSARASKAGKASGKSRSKKLASPDQNERQANANTNANATPAPTQTPTKTEHSDSDSDSDSTTDTATNSREKEHSRSPDGPIVPEKFRGEEFTTAWDLWKAHVHEVTHSRLGSVAEEVQLKDLAEQFNASEAIRVIEFSIGKRAKNLITDGSHNRAKSRTNENAAMRERLGLAS